MGLVKHVPGLQNINSDYRLSREMGKKMVQIPEYFQKNNLVITGNFVIFSKLNSNEKLV